MTDWNDGHPPESGWYLVRDDDSARPSLVWLIPYGSEERQLLWAWSPADDPEVVSVSWTNLRWHSICGCSDCRTHAYPLIPPKKLRAHDLASRMCRSLDDFINALEAWEALHGRTIPERIQVVVRAEAPEWKPIYSSAYVRDDVSRKERG